MSKQRVLITQQVASPGLDFLREQGYELVFSPSSDAATVAALIEGCQAALVRSTVFDEALIERARDLLIIARHGVGYDNVDLAAAAQRGIYVTNTPLANSNAVAEYTIMLLLACSKCLQPVQQEHLAGDYQVRDRIFCGELSGKTLGIIGLGSIGRQVARMAKTAFNMKVIADDHHSAKLPQPEAVDERVARDEVFARADFVSLHIPSTPQTRSSVGKRELELMRPTAWLINTARGDIVVEEDLLAALDQGKIAGAALDVLAQEPFDYQNKLFTYPNVLITPHYAAHTLEAFDAMSLHAAWEIDRVLRGEAPRWPVNRVLHPANQPAR